MKGWDVAELQFQLAWHGFPSSFFTGTFNDHVRAALIRFQRRAQLAPDGILGTLDAERASCAGAHLPDPARLAPAGTSQLAVWTPRLWLP